MQRQVPAIKYYYMGFYIHSCPKMRYKANLHASYLLCPETYVWFPIEQCIPKLDKQKYCRFNEDPEAVDKDACCITSDMDPLMILVGYKNCVPYRIYREKVQGSEGEYGLFCNLIGKKCITRLLVVSRADDFEL